MMDQSFRRDRLTFSKSILKRYMKECVTRETNSTTSPWIVKPSIAKALGIEPILLPTPTTTNDSDQKVDGGGGSKRGRKSNVTNVGGEETASKRRKMGQFFSSLLFSEQTLFLLTINFGFLFD